MALKVSEVIDLIEPNYGDGNPRTFFSSLLGDYWIAGGKQRDDVLNPDDFKKSLFIAPFTKTDDSEHYSIYKDKFELGEKTENNEKNFQFISSSCLYKHSGSIESFVFTNEIFTKIIEADKIVSLIDLAVEKRKLKELIEAVVEIDNKPETQDKLLPKIIKASDDAEKLKELIEASVIVIKLPQLVEAAFEAGRL